MRLRRPVDSTSWSAKPTDLHALRECLFFPSRCEQMPLPPHSFARVLLPPVRADGTATALLTPALLPPVRADACHSGCHHTLCKSTSASRAGRWHSPSTPCNCSSASRAGRWHCHRTSYTCPSASRASRWHCHHTPYTCTSPSRASTAFALLHHTLCNST
jgi:hypothetical protein